METPMATKVTSDGQVAIPKDVLDHLGVTPGSEVDFKRTHDGSIVIEKAGAARPLDPDRFEKLRGIAGPGLSTDELMALLRGD
jgi:AbrB family looped-hinge helix DNA binding protein